MKPGVYNDISNADYHGGEGVSKSMLDVLAQSSPLHLYCLRNPANDNEPRKATPAQELGTAFHALLLEPEMFVRDYCLALRQQDVPDAIADRDTLVAMVGELNKGRLPKLSTIGTKDELVARLMAEVATGEAEQDGEYHGKFSAMKGAELKAQLEAMNAQRPGLLSDKGTMSELATILRMHGKPITLWSDVKQQWMENNGHRTVLDAETWDQLHRMRDAVMAHPAARNLLTAEGWAERSVYWTDAKTGEPCRCRPDRWLKNGILLDVKTTLDASPEGFARSVANYRYHVQHPYYLDGINTVRQSMIDAREELPQELQAEASAMVFLAVEKDACVVDGKAKGVALYYLDDASVELGRVEYRRDLDTYAQCRKTGEWPGYGDKIMSLSVPQWTFSKHAHLLENAA